MNQALSQVATPFLLLVMKAHIALKEISGDTLDLRPKNSILLLRSLILCWNNFVGATPISLSYRTYIMQN